jgi:putative toxin-antitoxin system antitoxin component (TIGR02293 family)
MLVYTEKQESFEWGNLPKWNDDRRSYELVRAVRNGISYQSFETLMEKAPFLAKEWAGFLNISTKTLERHKEERRDFKPVQSEKIIAIYQLLNYGFEVFEDWDNLFHWIKEKNIALGNERLIDLLDTNIGVDIVKKELGRIEHGILA